jgi:hypothetical protein
MMQLRSGCAPCGSAMACACMYSRVGGSAVSQANHDCLCDDMERAQSVHGPPRMSSECDTFVCFLRRPEDMAERLEAAVMRERPGLLEGFREARRARKEGCKSIWESVVGSSACGDEMGDSKGVPLGGESSDAFSFGFSGNSTSEPAAAKNGGADDGASGGPAAAFSFGF